eukprot:TRINITY_DN13937_c0_g1_i10.p1 TRINITY_DN13937_c0_g1~~TRINITY_DN13937_c0_g1_i10.p1  ORF type:complete len:114 (+),score=10.93 TRINITY_DN13937_c0_g1_i10:21-362(+)
MGDWVGGLTTISNANNLNGRPPPLSLIGASPYIYISASPIDMRVSICDEKKGYKHKNTPIISIHHLTGPLIFQMGEPIHQWPFFHENKLKRDLIMHNHLIELRLQKQGKKACI